MKLARILKACGLAIIGLAWMPGQAAAEQIRLDFSQVTPRLDVTVKLQKDDGSFQSISTHAGIYNWVIDNPSLTSRFGPSGTVIQTFCIELLQHTASDVVFDIVPLTQAPSPGMNTGDYNGANNPDGPMSSLDAIHLQRLWGTYRSQITDAQTAAAFQLAVWEIVFDGGLDLLNGSFLVSSISGKSAGHASFDSVYSIAQGWLNTLNDSSLTRETRLMAISNPHKQDQLIVDPVPAPPALVLAGLGFAGVGLLGWRRRPV